MNKLYYLIVSVAIVILNSSCGNAIKGNFFRKDYTLVSDGFYKVHRILNNYWEAKRRCSLEGALLWIPESESEVKEVISMWKKEAPSITFLYLGITDLISEGFFQSIDGRSIHDLYNVWQEGEPYDNGDEDCLMMSIDGKLNDVNCSGIHNFMCKKSKATLEWDDFCDVPDMRYIYNKDVSKCYKIHQNPKTWVDAFSICEAEQSYLAIINSQKEADILTKFYQNTPKENYKGKMNRDVIHMGFRYGDDEEWTTIKGVRLEENGYTKWADNQPDNYHKADNCGGMAHNGELHDVDCSDKCVFICEHDIGPLSISLNERNGN